MQVLEQFAGYDLSVKSRTRQVLCLVAAFVLAFILFLKLGECQRVLGILVSILAIEVGVSTLWSP